jgi:hypothetical protein
MMKIYSLGAGTREGGRPEPDLPRDVVREGCSRRLRNFTGAERIFFLSASARVSAEDQPMPDAENIPQESLPRAYTFWWNILYIVLLFGGLGVGAILGDRLGPKIESPFWRAALMNLGAFCEAILFALYLMLFSIIPISFALSALGIPRAWTAQRELRAKGYESVSFREAGDLAPWAGMLPSRDELAVLPDWRDSDAERVNLWRFVEILEGESDEPLEDQEA